MSNLTSVQEDTDQSSLLFVYVLSLLHIHVVKGGPTAHYYVLPGLQIMVDYSNSSTSYNVMLGHGPGNISAPYLGLSGN